MFFNKKHKKRIQELEYENANLKRRIRQDEQIINRQSLQHENLSERYKKATDYIQELQLKNDQWKPLSDFMSKIPIHEGDPVSIPDRIIKIFQTPNGY